MKTSFIGHYKIPAILLSIIMIACSVSCKKKGGAAPFSNLRIATVDHTHMGAIEHYRIVYNQYSDVDSIVYVGDGTAAGTSGYDVMNYFSSSFSVTDANNNSFTVYGNATGMISEVLTFDTLIMHYNSSNKLNQLDTKSPTTTYPFYLVSSVYYNWANGDLTDYGPAGSTSGSYYYDLSHSGQPGDPQRVNDFLTYGRSYIKSNHLPKGLTRSGDTIEAYYYQFNTLGQISQLMVVDNLSGIYDTATYNYRYY